MLKVNEVASQEEFISWYVDSQIYKFKDPIWVFKLLEFPSILENEIGGKLIDAFLAFIEEKGKVFQPETSNMYIFKRAIILALREKYFTIQQEEISKIVE